MARTIIDIQLDAAVGLLQNYARTLPVALAHVDRELYVLDGWPASTMADGMPRGEATLNAVERAAEARLRLSATRATLIDDRDAILALIASALHVCRDAAGMRAPVEAKRCGDAQYDGDGGARMAGVDEWGQKGCIEMPAKADLCSSCYQRARRWRIANGRYDADTMPAA